MQRYAAIVGLAMRSCSEHGEPMTKTTQTSATSSLTLIVGGSGKTGRRVADRLTARGLPVRIASRSAIPRFDWSEPATWDAALDGATAMYVSYAPDLAAPAAAPAIRALAKRAVERGVRHIVLLSGRGEPQVLPAERAAQDSGAVVTILRAAWFAQNFSEGHFAPAVQAGELAFLAGDVREPFIDADDIAEVAVAALTDDRHAGRIHEITGPGLLTFAEAMAAISRAAGRDIRYTTIGTADYAASLAPYMPAEDIGMLTELFAHVLDGHNGHVTDGVERVLGRPARDFGAYARDAAATGVWAA
jgi:uncharacterized protein YbjT (DUF2867 family)